VPSSHLIFFATDVHGSEVCFRKWLNASAAYGADVLIMGGDLTGKVIVPVHRIEGRHRARWGQEDIVLDGDAELEAFRKRVADAGAYVWQVEPDEAAAVFADDAATDALFTRLTSDRIAEWVALAETRIGDATQAYIIAGNDDSADVDVALARGERLQLADNRAVMIDEWLPMVSLGDSTPTPWRSPRELTEEEYAAKLEAIIASVDQDTPGVWNVHVPPHASTLDDAPAIDDQLAVQYTMAGDVKMLPVGSRAVRAAIERHRPLVGLHGHVHEGRGRVKIGRTICFNPGSSYQQGVLQGVLVRVDRKKGVRDHTLTTG
jgi:Icc-related predicted phosphoesterase